MNTLLGFLGRWGAAILIYIGVFGIEHHIPNWFVYFVLILFVVVGGGDEK